MEAIERRWVARRREAVAAGHVMGPRRSAQNAGLGGADVETDDLAPAGLMDGVRDHDRLARNAAAVVDLLDLGVDEQIRVHHLSGLDSWPSPGVVEHALRDLVCCADRRRRRSADVDAARDAVRSAALRRRWRAAADGARLAAKPATSTRQRRWSAPPSAAGAALCAPPAWSAPTGAVPAREAVVDPDGPRARLLCTVSAGPCRSGKTGAPKRYGDRVPDQRSYDRSGSTLGDHPCPLRARAVAAVRQSTLAAAP
jgi:hypothetical protein